MDKESDFPSYNNKEVTPADPSLSSHSQYMDDKEALNTKKDQQFGWTYRGLSGCCAKELITGVELALNLMVK